MKNQYFATSKQKMICTFLGIFFLVFSAFTGYVTFIIWSASALDTYYRITSPLFFLIGIFWTLHYFYRGYHENIILSKKGLEYNAFGYVVNIKWDAIKQIGIKWDNTYKSVGVFASDYSMRKKFWLPNMFKEIFIPLSFFSSDWRDSELGQQIKKHAPHLFQ
jgi:hypothetical protein